jgi:hypothetical protein
MTYLTSCKNVTDLFLSLLLALTLNIGLDNELLAETWGLYLSPIKVSLSKSGTTLNFSTFLRQLMDYARHAELPVSPV